MKGKNMTFSLITRKISKIMIFSPCQNDFFTINFFTFNLII